MDKLVCELKSTLAELSEPIAEKGAPVQVVINVGTLVVGQRVQVDNPVASIKNLDGEAA